MQRAEFPLIGQAPVAPPIGIAKRPLQVPIARRETGNGAEVHVGQVRNCEGIGHGFPFEAKVAIDSTRLRNVSPLAMTPAQRDIVAHIAMLPEEERLELVRYLSAQLLGRGGMTRR